MKLKWRIFILITTIMLIYLLFPIFIVPSPLPVIDHYQTSDVLIFQLEGEKVLTVNDWLEYYQRRHRQGIAILLGRD